MGARIGLTEADGRRMADMYRAGATLLDVAIEFECSDVTVRVWLKRLGVPRRKSVQRPQTTQDKRIIRAYRDGVPAREIAERFRVSVPFIYTVLRRNGLAPNRMSAEQRSCCVEAGRRSASIRHGKEEAA